PAEAEDDAALVLPRDLDRRRQEHHRQEGDHDHDDDDCSHEFPGPRAGSYAGAWMLAERTSSVSPPSTVSTTTSSPGTSGSPLAECAFHSSPRTATTFVPRAIPCRPIMLAFPLV